MRVSPASEAECRYHCLAIPLPCDTTARLLDWLFGVGSISFRDTTGCVTKHSKSRVRAGHFQDQVKPWASRSGRGTIKAPTQHPYWCSALSIGALPVAATPSHAMPPRAPIACHAPQGPHRMPCPPGPPSHAMPPRAPIACHAPQGPWRCWATRHY